MSSAAFIVSGVMVVSLAIGCGSSNNPNTNHKDDDSKVGRPDKDEAESTDGAKSSGDPASKDEDKDEDKDKEKEASAGSPADRRADEPRGPQTGGAGAGGSPSKSQGTDSGNDAKQPAKEPTAMQAGAGANDCEDGRKRVQGECVCDMSGTFALRQQITTIVSGVPGFGSMNTKTGFWGILRVQAADDGRLKLAFSTCGHESADSCSPGSPLLRTQPEAYAQYISSNTWEKLKPVEFEVQLAKAVPGAMFETPVVPSLQGIELTDPLGAWPSMGKDVEGSPDFGGSALNGARWVDVDGDGQPGLTTYLVPPGGVAAGGPTAPHTTYAATSPECPSGDPKAPRSPYAYLPALYDGGVVRVKRIYAAQRVATMFRGPIESCDKVTGQVLAREGAQLRPDSLVAGCVLADGAGEMPCPPRLVEMLAGSSVASQPGVKIESTGAFVMLRAPEEATCSQVRAMSFE